MIDVHDVHGESLVPINDASEITPGRPHLATVYRWFTKGVRGGIKLETVLVGGRRFTSREAIQRFCRPAKRRPWRRRSTCGHQGNGNVRRRRQTTNCQKPAGEHFLDAARQRLSNSLAAAKENAQCKVA